MVKKITAIILALTIMVGMGTTVFAEDTNDIVDKKQKFMLAAQQDYYSNIQSKSSEILSIEDAQILLAKISTGMEQNNGENKELLKNSGIYIMESAFPILPRTSEDASYISMSSPTTAYNAATNEWIVTGGGYYHDTSFLGQIVTIMARQAIGGQDGYGVSFTNVSGTYNTRIKRQNGYISNGEGLETTSTSRSDGDGKVGFGFRFQDYGIRDSSSSVGVQSYLGKHFAAQAIYDSNFVNYSGTATSYHIHTYSNAKISSVSLSVTSGLSVSFSNADQAFIAYSTDEFF